MVPSIPTGVEYSFLITVFIQFIAAIFVLRWTIKRLSGIELNLFWSLGCIIINTYVSSWFFKYLVKLGGCGSDDTGLYCRFLDSSSMWNMSLFIWQTPVYGLILLVILRVIKKQWIPLLQSLYIVLLNIAFGKACFITMGLFYRLK
jgi:hypothetical protein